MALASKIVSPLLEVPYTVKNTFINVTPSKGGKLRSRSAPPTALSVQVVAEDPKLADLAACQLAMDLDDQSERKGRAAMVQMQLLTNMWNLKTSRWIRVVHSGYGSATWEDALRRSELSFVAAKTKPEGVYVYVPPETGKDRICQALKQINFAVRRDTYFKEMKRSNKSRLQFKEDLVVDADGLIQEEEAATSAGSAFGSLAQSSCSCSVSGDEFGADPIGDLASGSRDIDSFLAPEKLAVAASPTAWVPCCSPTASAPSTPREATYAEMPGDSVLDYYQDPPQPREYSLRELFQAPPCEYAELQTRQLAQQPQMFQEQPWSSQPSMVPQPWSSQPSMVPQPSSSQPSMVPIYMCVGVIR
jgi:hypothetical protein